MAARNGTSPAREYIFDPESPEYIKDLQRPAVIKEDLTEMERRKRVQQILESKSFLKELEEVIRQETEVVRSEPEHLKMVQRISELTLPNGAMSFANLHAIAGTTIPIADLKGNESYSKMEKIQRNKLASLYRLVDLFQWSQGIYNHITLRLPGEEDQILMNPFGLLYNEVTASSLVRVNLKGEVIDHGSTNLGINQAGYVLHSAIHSARPAAQCVLHLHTAVVSAVASMTCGLLPLCQEAMIIGKVASHDYTGILDDESERKSIIASLGEANVMLLPNHGFVVCGRSVEEALHFAYHTIIACETQVLMFSGDGFLVVGDSLEEAVWLTRNLVTACDQQIRAAKVGIENLRIPSEEAVQKAYNTARRGGGGVNREGQVQWDVGELEWEAWMRVLDHAGFRTGHLYKQPHLRPKSQMSQSMYATSDVALPPSTTAIGLLDESDPEAIIAHKLALLRREQEKVKWLNSPNAYQKVEFLETGTDCPKRITKWVQDPKSHSANGTPVKISSPHQFSPMSANPKEFKDKQKKIKEIRRSGNTSAGPQSQIFDGVTYDEISMIKPDVDGIVGQTDRTVLIGTASKGIIDRQHQHNAQVYRQLYAPNPFAIETDDDIKKYMEDVELKSPKSRTPCSSARDASMERDYRTSSPFDDEPEADTASLMQGILYHRNSDAAHLAAASMDGIEHIPTLSVPINVGTPRDTTIDSSRAESRSYIADSLEFAPQVTSTPKSRPFSRSKSERPPARKLFGSGNTSARSNVTASEDEGSHREEKKKKKGFFSFMKKKDKSSS